ncbi:serine/threonine-protein kinase [Actinoallomurus purpureus]|nr:serine/threonine-protein kinase [Actinoallomurus purpureus]
MGQVFLGWSPGGRKVAVKVIRPEHAGDVEFRVRFGREVEAARRVGGFHTAQVVDADPQADPPWLVTAFVEGPSLLELVRGGGPLGVDAVRVLGAGLAEGLSAVHGCGLVHRDLKPGNVIMSADGPRIIDFGIARDAHASTLTAAGVVMGTFSFMSPEQVRAEVAGPGSDVFSLGCVLAYAATGRGPFDAGTIPAIVHRVLYEPPRLDGITGPLLPIIVGCLAKDIAQRPSIPNLLAQLGTAGIPAPGPTPAVASPPIPRRALLAGAAAVVGIAAVGTPAALLWPSLESKGASKRNEPSRLGNASARGTDPVVLRGPNRPETLVFSQDGKTIGASGTDGAIWLLEAATGRSISVAHVDVPKYVQPIEFSPDLKLLARGEEKVVRVFDAATGRAVDTLSGYTENVRAIAFSPDGKTLAVNAGGETIRVRDMTTRRETTLRSKVGPLDAAAFSPDGRLLAFGNNNNSELVRVDGGRSVAILKWSRAHSLAFSPDGKTLAIGGIDGDVGLCDVAEGRVTAKLGEEDMFSGPGMVYSLAFSPDGKTLVVAHAAPGSATVRVWDLAGRRIRTTLANAAAPVVFSPDGKLLAAAAYGVEGGVQLWKAP